MIVCGKTTRRRYSASLIRSFKRGEYNLFTLTNRRVFFFVGREKKKNDLISSKRSNKKIAIVNMFFSLSFA